MPAPLNDDRSLFTLVGELPDRVSDLVKAEIDQIKAEISYKLKHFGIGSGLFAGALVMPAWAAALTVSGILVVIIAILAWIGMINFKRGNEPLESIESLRKDLDMVKGTGEYDRD